MAKSIGGLTNTLTAATASATAAYLPVEQTSTSYKMTLRELRKATVDVFNVVDYGATGDGSTDDTQAIQDAIDAATDGATIIFPGPATYVASNLICTTDGVTFAGRQAVLKRPNATSGFTLSLRGERDVIDGLSFDGNSAGQTGTQSNFAEVQVYNNSKCVVANCFVSGAYGFGIRGIGCNYTSIRDNNVAAEYMGIYVETLSADATGNRITGNIVDTSDTASANGIYLTGSNDAIDWDSQLNWNVSNNEVIGATTSASGAGITLRAESGICSGNVVTGYGLGITADRTNRSAITGNRVDGVNGTYKQCIEVLGRHNTISGNYCRPAADGTGIEMSMNDLSFNTITGNTLEHGTGSFTGINCIANADVALTVDHSSGTFTSASAHDFLDGERVQIYGSALPTGLTATTTYWVVNATETTFKVSATRGGSAVSMSDSGSGVYARHVICGVSISGNTINTNYRGIRLARYHAGTVIEGNSIWGPGYSTASSAAMFFDEMNGSAIISSNRMFGFESYIVLYSAASLAYSHINVIGNSFYGVASVDGTLTEIVLSGSATYGNRITSVWNDEAGENINQYWDMSRNQRLIADTSYTTPEGNITAGPGSWYYRRFSPSAGASVWVKETGTGNTGWVSIT